MERQQSTVKALFKQKGLSTREVAKLMGLAPSAVSYWAAGTKEPSLENACKLSIVLECSLEEVAEAFGFEFYKESPATPTALASLFSSISDQELKAWLLKVLANP